MYIFWLLVDVVGCSQEIDPYYGINWPSVRINVVATNSCPDGTGMNKYTTFNV